MKTFAIVLAVGLLSAAPAFAEDVTVTLTGVEARGGQILASLQTEGEFMQHRGAYGVVTPAPAADGAVTVVFRDVAPGAYALSAMHDENGDYEMQMSENGRPSEGWAMSNAASLRARPTFDAVRFEVGAAPVALSEPMIYPQAN